jgi:hypothetical protein
VALGVQVQQLRKEKLMLEAEIETLNSKTIASIEAASQKIRIVADNLRFDFENESTGYEATIKVLGESARAEMKKELIAQKESLKQNLESANRLIKEFVADAETIKRENWDTGKLLGFHIHLTRLANLLDGKQIPSVEALVTMKMTVDAFNDYLTRNQLDKRCPRAVRFSAELRGMLV